MTQYFLITKEELDWIKNDCKHPLSAGCDGCECARPEDDLPCTFMGANALMDEVLERPYSPQVEREKMLALITENNRVLKIALERVESLTERATKPVYNHGQFAALINSVIERNEAELRQEDEGKL